MTDKIGILVVKDIKCTLNHNATTSQRLASIRRRREIHLAFQYGDDEMFTRSVRPVKGQDKKKETYYTESLTLPIAKIVEEFKVTCYDASTILGFTGDTLKNALSEKRPSDKDMDKGTKVKLNLIRGEETVGEVSFNLMFLAMDAPKEKMQQVKLESSRGQTIGIMMIDKIKVKNRYGHKGYLQVILDNEMASTENYYTTAERECPYGIILPVVATPDLSIKLQIHFSNFEVGNFRIYLEENLWLKLMDGGQVSVPEISLYVRNNLSATVNLKISIHQPLNPLQLVEEATLIDFHGSGKTNPIKHSLNHQDKLESDSNDDDRKKISSQHSSSPPSTTAESLENSEDKSTQLPPMSRQTSTTFTDYSRQSTSTKSTNSIRRREIMHASRNSFNDRSLPSTATESTNSIRRRGTMHTSRDSLNPWRDTRDSSLRIICEKYLIISKISAGPHKTVNNNAFSNRVYLTKNIRTSSECICKKHFFESSFSNETKYLKKLQSEHIVKWVDLVPHENGGGFIVLEYFGESLDKVNFQFQKINSILQVFYNICEAVLFLHNKGVVHTDLCPSNIICAEPQRTNIRLCDLEHVKYVDEVIQFQQQPLTIGFTPPEFFIFNQDVLFAGFNQDIFGLGAILFFIYSKKLLYNDKNSLYREFDNRINEKIKEDYISNVIIKSCKPNPEERCEISELCEDETVINIKQHSQHSQHNRGSGSNRQHSLGSITREHFERGIESEAFNRLEDITKTINLLKEFKTKYAELNLRPPSTNNSTNNATTNAIPHQQSPSMTSMSPMASTSKSVKRTVTPKYEKPRKSLKTNVEDTPTITSEVYAVNVHDLPNDPFTSQPPPSIFAPTGVSLPSTPRTHTHAPLDPNLLKHLDDIFVNFLQQICSDYSKGEQIHQTLMAKKMQKLDESPDFRPFKFRIQAFTNAFHEELLRHGYTEEILPSRKDGKKAKSKGNHVWNIEAKKTPTGGWIFREFNRKIAGVPDRVAYIGMEYRYSPRVWDPQVNVKSVFHSPWLPEWLRWENNVLTGTPGIDSESCEITAIANYYHGDTVYKLEKSFVIAVAHPDSAEHQINMNSVAMADYQLQPHLEY
ncbi:2182_t:CDS:10 [Diversispora eburnea]|uniref:2182_t:CDS:1 n=1 Tax=Diversispora eburnea TaxID=1213867 RepID=A0A9N9A505_9GLOM|nr:2182_t:CDS:10 [Diversispora eburnea]